MITQCQPDDDDEAEHPGSDDDDPEDVHMDEGDEEEVHGGEDDMEEGSEEPEPMKTLSPMDLLKVVDMVDTNHDTAISADEFRKFLNKMTSGTHEEDLKHYFNSTDSNKDGLIDLEEYTHDHEGDSPEDEADRAEHAEYRKHQTATFKSADKDGNGKLNETEARAALRPHLDPETQAVAAKYEMKMSDEDKDGELTLTEFMAAAETEHVHAEKEFKRLDKDGNGKLNLEEFAAWNRDYQEMQSAIDWLVDKADTDHDGRISDEELVRVHDHKDFHTSKAHSYFEQAVDKHGEL